MNEAVNLLLSLSLSGCIVAALLFALKPWVKHRLSKTIQYYLWLIVLVRLLLPVSFESSVMNQLFYGNEEPRIIATNSTTILASEPYHGGSLSGILPSIGANERVDAGVYQDDSEHGRSIRDLVSSYIIVAWLLGVVIVLSVNLFSYARFANNLKQGNIPAAKSDEELLAKLVDRRSRVRLFRNALISTPMLIGIWQPRIIIPDIPYTEKQLENILRHEIVHFKRFDIVIKWITMLAAAIHWFNPLLIVIKKEINRACELACDEAVIKNLCPADKQAYGDMLLSIAAAPKYPTGVFQATMYAEKQTLKERLIAIMKHNNKPKWVTALSGMLLLSVIGGAIYLGAGTGTSEGKYESGKPLINEGHLTDHGDDTGLASYNLVEISQFRTPYIGNHMKVGGVAGRLPVPDQRFVQQYISLETSKRPYGLTIYHEFPAGTSYDGEWPIQQLDTRFENILISNALVAFSMIDNMDEITFAYRNSPSTDGLDKSKYDTSFTYYRSVFETEHGDLTVLGNNIDLLQEALAERARVQS